MKYLVAFLLSGCAGIGFNGMSADQIHEAVKDKNSLANCIQITGAGGQATALTLHNDKGVIGSGSATLECGPAKATFSNQTPGVIK